MCVPTVQVGEGGLQQLGEAGGPRLSRCSLLTLQVWGLLVLQLKLCHLQHQGFLPHRPLSWRPTLWEGLQIRYGETKSEDGVRRQEGEGGVELGAVSLRGQ